MLKIIKIIKKKYFLIKYLKIYIIILFYNYNKIFLLNLKNNNFNLIKIII